MRNYYPGPLVDLIESLMYLPGIGVKTAQRLAFHILESSMEDAQSLSDALAVVHEKVRHCEICNNISDDDLCVICNDHSRDDSIICVVESPRDIVAIEKSGGYRGVYHVLGGLISPMEGIGPRDLNVKSLIDRVHEKDISEVIFAISASVEGEATTLYISGLLKSYDVKTSCLAYGIPVGGDLEYADEVTLSRAMSGRRSL